MPFLAVDGQLKWDYWMFGGMCPVCGSLARAARADPSLPWSIARVVTDWCGKWFWRA